jgi:hypothetical protein
MSRFVFSLILCMTVASNQPSLALANDVENLVVKNAQPKKGDSHANKRADSVDQKNIDHRDKNARLAQPDRKSQIKAKASPSHAHVDLGFPYKATVPEMRPKTSVPDAHEMRSEIDAFLRGDSKVLRGYDAR